METITSRDNWRIKEAAKLLKSRTNREKAGLFLAEGLRICLDAAKTTGLARTLFVTRRAYERSTAQVEELISFCGERFLVSEEAAARLSDTKTSQGVFCLFELPQAKLPAWGGGEQILILEQVSDPGNLGTILRTAEAFGVSRVLVSDDSVDLYSPKTLRASMGSSLRQQVEPCPDVPGALTELKSRGFHTYAATLTPESVPVGAVSLAAPSAVVVGNEANGVKPETALLCEKQIILPMEGEIESLNAAVAAGVLLWEMKKARETAGKKRTL